eukprot:TRINITY_DN6682_c1_g1_i1.p5 TRINITY_DN6682_c1_g1~~TRINITY_DN6682_c1_g1_i1.p5  ORF type:complete len:116 (-),score=3.16 TRINITY_DN6682_c1_g1_i1:67-414(-)
MLLACPGLFVLQLFGSTWHDLQNGRIAAHTYGRCTRGRVEQRCTKAKTGQRPELGRRQMSRRVPRTSHGAGTPDVSVRAPVPLPLRFLEWLRFLWKLLLRPPPLPWRLPLHARAQ